MSDADEISSNTTSSNYNAFGSQKLQLSTKMFQDDYKAKQLKELPPMHSSKLKPMILTKEIAQPERTHIRSLSNFIFANSRNPSYQNEESKEISSKSNYRYNVRGKVYLQQLKMIENEKSREALDNHIKPIENQAGLSKNLLNHPIMY